MTDDDRSLADQDATDPLAEATRRLLRAVRRTEVGTDDRAAAIERIEAAATALEAEASAGPFWQTGLTSLEDFSLDTDPLGLFPYSPALGTKNPVAPGAQLRITEERTVEGTITFTEQFSGPPWDTTHGGIIALVYDDLVGMAAMVGAGGGMTARLTVNYRRPTPLFEPIELRAWLESHEDRKFVARGEMRLRGELLTEADGLFIRPQGFPPGTGTG